MTVRFKCQSEYQRSYGTHRSRSVSPQRCTPLAGLRSDQMVVTREPRLQHRRKLGPVGPARSCSSLLFPADVQNSEAEPAARSHTASRSRSADTKEPKPPTPPKTPAGPRPAADPRPSEPPEPAAEPASEGKPAKPRPSRPDNQSQPSRPQTAAPDGQQQEDGVMRWRAGLRSRGQRSEYHRQFGWKKNAASPLLSAEQVLNSVPSFKKNSVPMETEYRRSFLGQAPPTGPRLRKHMELQRVPLFHTHATNRRREEPQKKLRSEQEAALRDDAASHLKATPPPQVQRGLRNPEGCGATEGDAHQVKELRQQALSYRQRAWGTNFSRGHLSQLLSEHNFLWEPSDATDSPADTATPRPTADLHPEADSRSPSHVEVLDLASNSSKTASVVGSGGKRHIRKKTQTNQQTPPGPPERRTAWGEEEEEEEENTDEEEGRLPTPRLKMRPVQRTHHDLTTPAAGGAIIVGKLKGADDLSPSKQRSGSSVSTATRAETVADLPAKPKEAWSDNNPASVSHSSEHKPASNLPSKPIRTKQTPMSPVAPPPLVPLPQHCIQGTLRHPDFQHNGELGLRFRELPCPGGGCGSDEDDRLSVMSWRSAASCSMASAVLERAQKRRENFWGKR
ncbi:nuclear protein MDM1 isoform X2 [Acanthochromis polyacanthus]|uniref:nuclear protein MDM1 isoform X2 n=1 Tax=Acanthochromis polyacanthus TaxID=80966 RepID=UPI002234DFDA|nr:nuclear protein MDM1 isoform X2 [Acanthochromis polyacanthus]